MVNIFECDFSLIIVEMLCCLVLISIKYIIYYYYCRLIGIAYKKEIRDTSLDEAVLIPETWDCGIDIIGIYKGLHFVVQCKCQRIGLIEMDLEIIIFQNKLKRDE